MTIPTSYLNHTDAEAARKARATYRDGLVAPTSGIAPGFTQANMIVLPRDWAFDFLLYAQRNPKPCPVLDVSDPGSPTTLLAPGADLRTDLPLYRIWRDGKLASGPWHFRVHPPSPKALSMPSSAQKAGSKA